MKTIPLICATAIGIGVLFIASLPWSGLSAGEKTGITGECLTCHENYDRSLRGTAHTLLDESEPVPVMCSDCHTGAEIHIEGPEAANITNPATLTAREEAALCRTCHFTDHQQHMSEGNVHFDNTVACSSCHKIHDNTRQFYLLRDEEPELCYGCHQPVRGEFSSPYRHPVADGVMTCSECHTYLDRAGNELGAGRMSESCYQCHNEMRGPFPYEHQAIVDYSTEEGGCLNCHAPHGSNLPRMLTQPLNRPNYALCAQCHIVPGHQFNSYHGSLWADRDCMECHVDIHGSYFNTSFLKPSLPDEEGQNCFASGCHGH